MSGTEIDRLEIITRAAARELRQSVAAKRLSLSLRQIHRLGASISKRWFVVWFGPHMQSFFVSNLIGVYQFTSSPFTKYIL